MTFTFMRKSEEAFVFLGVAFHWNERIIAFHICTAWR